MDIVFKSTPDNWKKEYLGLKRNTVRSFADDFDDIRRKTLDDYRMGIINILVVVIVNANNPVERFEKEITDVTFFDGYYIISW